VFIRQPDGEYWLGVGEPQNHLILGDSLGHVRDEPWRKAEAGSLADAHNRIDALQARVDKMEQRGAHNPIDYNGVLVSGCIHIGEARKQSQRVPPAKPTQPPDVAMTTTQDKTPGQVAYWAWFKTKHTPGNPMALWEKVAAAVIANAAPKWHPVSEPVPNMDASYHVGSLTYGNKFENKNIVVGWQVKHHPCGYTHWCGPIEPPPFQEKP